MWGYTELTVEENQYEKKIFIVNDDKSLLDMYLLEFKHEGFNVTPAFGAVDAIEKLRGGIHPDAVIIDIAAPVMDSFDLLAVIRGEKLVPSAKIIVISDEQESAVLGKIQTLEIAGYLLKTTATPAQVTQKVVSVLGLNAQPISNN